MGQSWSAQTQLSNRRRGKPAHLRLGSSRALCRGDGGTQSAERGITMNQRVAVVPASLKETDQVTCTLPWYVEGTEYHPVMATYQPLINGEEAFRAVHQAIAQA